MTNITISGTNSNSNIILNSGSASINANEPTINNSLLDFSGINLVGVGTWKEYLVPGTETAT